LILPESPFSMIQERASASLHSSHYISIAGKLIAQMTLEEKALLSSGDGWWKTHAIERLEVPSISISDGPHGLRKVVSGELGTSVPATCFPTASAIASSWNTDLIRRVGVALARECQARDVQILLGPGINMKRSPLGGRNFEYLSEDPVLTGKMAAAYIQGVQSQGIGTSLKHYAANSQEFERMATSSEVDERTLHEIYLPAFELAVKESQPWTVMAAYNSLNGVYCAENKLLLTDILRKKWGFQGFVVSDWGAVHDRVNGVRAGLSLEMPGSGDYNRKKIIQAVQNGLLSEQELDESVVALLAVILQAKGRARPGFTFDAIEHNGLARQAAGESIVLLKNDDQLLPLKIGKTEAVAVIGTFAKVPRYQGAGSSQVNPTAITTAYDELVKSAGSQTVIGYAAGYDLEGATTDALIEEAAKLAKEVEIAIVFAGLPDSYECEGIDRTSLDLPAGHSRLIDAVLAVQPNVAIVLMNGSAVTMPWAARAKAILEAWLGGQAGGGAIADVVLGRVNPSGKLSETFPGRLEDTPTYPDFPSKNREAEYREGIFVGYRHYDTRKVEPLFPFGYGLSYTTFAYSDIRTTESATGDSTDVLIEFKVKNTGSVAGQEVSQLYVHEQSAKVVRPEKELKAFAKLALEPGEQKEVRFQLTRRDFAYYDKSSGDWMVNPGKFDVLIGGSSRDLPLKATVEIKFSERTRLSRYSLLKEFERHPKGKLFYRELVEAFGLGIPTGSTGDAASETAEQRKADMAVKAFLDDMPVYKVCAFSEGRFSEERLNEILQRVS
jgi:beta-glucosidase